MRWRIWQPNLLLLWREAAGPNPVGEKWIYVTDGGHCDNLGLIEALRYAPHREYADNDPAVVAHSRALKTGPGVAVLGADLRDPGKILGHPATANLIDFAQPVAVLFVAVLHFIGDADDPHAVVGRYVSAAAPGSFLVISHVTGDPGPQTAADVAGVYAATTNPATPRPRDRILTFFDGLDLVEPGLVPVAQWRPDSARQAEPVADWMLGGVARKPG
jgi:S-adenosyl methyltransferase